jgi:hypothetical protein
MMACQTHNLVNSTVVEVRNLWPDQQLSAGLTYLILQVRQCVSQLLASFLGWNMHHLQPIPPAIDYIFRSTLALPATHFYNLRFSSGTFDTYSLKLSCLHVIVDI